MTVPDERELSLLTRFDDYPDAIDAVHEIVDDEILEAAEISYRRKPRGDAVVVEMVCPIEAVDSGEWIGLYCHLADETGWDETFESELLA